jgi:hypothetical protein
MSEYRMLVAPIRDSMTRKISLLIRIETVRSFSSFPFEIDVEESVAGNDIALTLRGLQTPPLRLTSAGPAAYQKVFTGVRGTVTITVRGLDGTDSRMQVKLTSTRTQIISPPDSTLIELSASRVMAEPPTEIEFAHQ